MPIRPLEQSSSLSERAYDAIKQAILSLELQPGEFMSIGSLASQLDVSRTPVREALLLLEQEGLVRLVPHKGAYVSELSVRDVEETFELRIVLERYAARTAATRFTSDELSRLDQLLTESKQAIDQGRFLEASDMGRRLHDALVEKVGNYRLMMILGQLDTHYTRFRRFAALMPGRLQKSHQQHLNIVTALKSRDGDRAEQALADHLASVRDDIIASIEQWLNENGQTSIPGVKSS